MRNKKSYDYLVNNNPIIDTKINIIGKRNTDIAQYIACKKGIESMGKPYGFARYIKGYVKYIIPIISTVKNRIRNPHFVFCSSLFSIFLSKFDILNLLINKSFLGITSLFKRTAPRFRRRTHSECI